MKKAKRSEERSESSVQVALGELMGLEEERQAAERVEARRREAEAARRRADDEARRRVEEAARLAALEARRREEERARAEEGLHRAREAAEREARIRAEAEARVRGEELRRVYETELQAKRIEQGRRRTPAWLAPGVAVLSVAGVGLFAALYFSVQAGAAKSLAEAERTRTSLKLALERELDAARAERLTAVSQLEDATRRFEDVQRRLNEQCTGIPVMGRPPKRHAPAAVAASAAQGGRDGDLDGLTEKPPWEADDSEDTIQLGGDKKKPKKGP
jgi:dTMP kinase